MKTAEKNYWPHAIVAMILFVVILGIWTIKTAIDFPVQEDNSFMMGYHELDSNVNDVLLKQAQFLKKYKIEYLPEPLTVGKNSIQIAVKEKEGASVRDANVTLLVTRPETRKYDQTVQLERQGNYYSVDNIELPIAGRWNLLFRVGVENLAAFKTVKTETK